MGKNNAKMIDTPVYIQAGINPKTKTPIRYSQCNLKDGILKQLEIIDAQDAINRYTWYNLPKGLTPQLMERILYYRGQAALFKLGDTFMFLPYALSAPEDSVGIDMYGRFTGITPLPFHGTTSQDKDDKKTPFQGLIWKPVYDVTSPEDFKDKSIDELENFIKTSCVLFKDYTEQISQTITPRAMLSRPTLDLMSDCLPFMRTALMNATGVKGMRVSNPDDSSNVYAANDAMYGAALNGEPNIPIFGPSEFQELTSGQYGKSEEFLLCLQSLDNYRLSTHGLSSGGLFQKRSHMLEAEQEMNISKVALTLTDGLKMRQQGAMIANSIWGTSIWCEVSESVSNADMTGEGLIGSGEQAESHDEQYSSEGGEENV